MNFNKEIKNTHDEIMKLHDKFQSLNDNVLFKLDEINQTISDNFSKNKPIESLLHNMDEHKDVKEINSNKVDIIIKQPQFINTIIVVMLLLNICVTGVFLLK